jgi:hypothetical protein
MAGCDDAVHPPAQTHVGYRSDHLCRRRASVMMPPALMVRYEGQTRALNTNPIFGSWRRPDDQTEAMAHVIGRGATVPEQILFKFRQLKAYLIIGWKWPGCKRLSRGKGVLSEIDIAFAAKRPRGASRRFTSPTSKDRPGPVGETLRTAALPAHRCRWEMTV